MRAPGVSENAVVGWGAEHFTEQKANTRIHPRLDKKRAKIRTASRSRFFFTRCRVEAGRPHLLFSRISLSSWKIMMWFRVRITSSSTCANMKKEQQEE